MSENSFSETITKAVEIWIKSDDDRNFSTIYTKMYKGLYGHIFKFVKDEDTTMDILSDTFMLIIKNKHQYDPNRGHFTTWAYNIAKNSALAYIGNEKKQSDSRIRGSEYLYNLVGNSASNEQSEEAESKQDYTNSEQKYDEEDEKTFLMLHQRAVQEIMNMNDTYREFLYDREIRNLSYEEISQKHDIKMNTVKSKIRLGREIIRHNLVKWALAKGINPESLSRLFSYRIE